MSDSPLNDEIKYDRNVKLDDIFNTPEDSDIGSFNENDLKYPDGMKGRLKNFSFCHEIKIGPQENFSKHMKDIKPVKYTQNRKLICDWIDKKKISFLHRNLKLYIEQGMVVDNFLEIISFRQNRWFE